MSIVRRIKTTGLLLATLAGLAAAGTQASAMNYRGGGALFNFEGCNGWSNAVAVTAVVTPASQNEAGFNELALFLNDAGILFNISDPFAPAGNWRRMFGTGIFGPTGNMDPRPRFRIRQLTFSPPGSTLETATEIDLRMNIRDFSWTRGCSAMLGLTLRRDG